MFRQDDASTALGATMVAYDPEMAADRRGGILLALVDAALTVGEAHRDTDEHYALPFDNVSERLERADHVLSGRASHEHRTGFVSGIAKELAHGPGRHSAWLNRHARANRARHLSFRDTHTDRIFAALFYLLLLA